MKDRGKAAAMENNYGNNNFSDFNYSVSSDMPCMKHPNSSPVGICSYCLKDRLLNLVCSECGEQRLSSCSCSDNSTFSNRNSCSVDVGSVGRISFLLENEKNTVQDQENECKKQEQVILLRSSSINCVEIKKNKNGFWKIKRLFKKKREKGVDEKSDICDGVSRSRSLCSFRNGGGFNETDDGGSDYRFSSAKISDVTGGLLFDPDEPRKSDFRYNGTGNDYRFSSAKISDVADEPRKSDFKNHSTRRGIFRVKESDFDDSAFIDLNLDLSSSSFSGKRLSNVSDHGYDSAASMGGLRGGSCRITTVNEFDRRMKRGNNSSSSSGKNKVWKWISGAARKSTSNRDENCDLIIKS